ncbi:MAG: hypothetical protein MUE47_09000, partial [Acidobacteria bacterium]|nr:hypothetical protein [Acidobacteriota bacterium]
EGGEDLLRVTTTVTLFGARSGRHQVDALSRGTPPATTRWTEVQFGKRARAMQVTGDRLEAWRFKLPAGDQLPAAGAWGKAEKTAKVTLPADAAAVCGAVDPYTLLLRLGCLAADPARRALLVSREGAALVRAEPTGQRSASTLRLRDLDRGQTVEAQLVLQRLVLRGGGGAAGETAFGMVGDISIWIDEASGAVVEIEGKHENVPGTIRLRARAFSRAAVPRPTPPWPFLSTERLDAGRPAP